MLEKPIQRLILRYAKKFLKDITMDKLSLWGGNVKLSNVELRLDVLQREVDLPVSARFAS